MGILDLFPHLKKEGAADAFQSIPITTLSQHRVAIDTSNWAFVYFVPKWTASVMSLANPVDDEPDITPAWTSTKEQWVNFNLDYLKVGITPIWIFDGKELPEKVETKKKRYEKSKKSKDDSNSLRDALRAVPHLLRQPQAIKEYKEKLSRSLPLRGNHILELKEMCIAIGIPYKVAPHEGEAYASCMTIEGITIATWCRDGDCQAIGCPIAIHSFEDGSRGQNIEVVLQPFILSGMKMDQTMFRDFCILCSCDFNERIYRVGTKTAEKKLKLFGSAEAYLTANPQLDWRVLNIFRCRELLGYTATGLQHDDATLNLNPEALAQTGFDMLKSLGLDGWYSPLVAIVSHMRPPQKADHSTMAILQPRLPMVQMYEPAPAVGFIFSILDRSSGSCTTTSIPAAAASFSILNSSSCTTTSIPAAAASFSILGCQPIAKSESMYSLL